MESKEKIRLLKDYIAVAQGETSKLFFCKKHDVNFREFTKIAYVIEAELVAENKHLGGIEKLYATATKALNSQIVINKQLKAELEKHRWIPVSERLPKHSCRLLAYGKDGYDYETVAAVSYDLEFKKFRVLSDVTHWKPIILPTKP